MSQVKDNLWIDIKNSWQYIDTKEKWLYILYTFLLVGQVLNLFRAVENRIGLSLFTEISDAFFIILAVLFTLPIFIRKLKVWDYLFVLAIGIYYWLFPMQNPSVSLWAEEGAELFLGSCLPLYLVGRTMDSDKSTTIFVWISYIAMLLQILFLYVLGVKENEQGEIELMSTAYGYLPFALFLVWDAFEHKTSIIRYIIAFIAAFLLFAMGTRGPIICFAAFIAVYIISSTSIKMKYKVLVGVLAGVVYYFSYQIIFLLSAVSASIGMSTRVYDSFLLDQMTNIEESNGRDVIWSDALDYTMKNDPLWGGGLFSDRIAGKIGNYVHNFEIEILCDFGIIGGGIILAVLLWLFVKAWKNSRGTNGNIFLIIFFCSSILMLQFSSSFLLTPIFWFFLGLCVSLATDKKETLTIQY